MNSSGNRFSYIPSFGRRGGRVIRKSRRCALEEVLPGISVQSSEFRVQEFKKENNYQEIWLEIGFGSGEHLAARAEVNPDIGFIGCEVYQHGVATLARQVQEKNLKNVRVFTEDARLLLETLPENSIDHIFILFPDPWPKKKHHKRRIINQAMLTELVRILRKGGALNLATDHMGYACWMLVHLNEHSGFEFTAENATDWQNPPEGHILTRYQQKQKAGTAPVFLNLNKM